MIPSECVSIPIIMHCLLEQVVWDEHMSHKDVTTPDASDKNVFKDSNIFTYSKTNVEGYNFDSLTLNFTETISNSQDVFEPKQTKPIKQELVNTTPHLISSGNNAKCDTFHIHLPEFNFEQLTTNMLSSSPIYKLWQRFPPQHPDISKWFKFQIQKLKQCTETSFVTDNDKLFHIFLQTSLMNLFVSSVSEIQKIPNDEEEFLQKGGHNLLKIDQQASTDVNSSLFAREIISSIVSIAPYISSIKYTNEEGKILLKRSEPSTNSSQLNVCLPLWYSSDINQEPEAYLSPLNEKKCHTENKLNVLKSFLNCNEFINLFEQNLLLERDDVVYNRLKNFNFIEQLAPNVMCQSLNYAFQSFYNINYDYFAPTDTILLWFNNSVNNKYSLTTSNIHCGILETPLCFRDFYRYKLKAKREFVYISTEGKDFTDNEGSIYSNGYKRYDTKGRTHNYETNEPVETPLTVYNLMPFRFEINDYVQSFFSPDSSSVTVIRTNVVNDEEQYSVKISKNDVHLQYNINNKISDKNVTLYLDFNEYLRASLFLSWDSSPDVAVNNDSNDLHQNINFYCSPTMTLSSGLKLEIISTHSTTGPFYIRQTYLTKGPSSSNIWDEAYRCYFNNGLMIIFYLNDAVEVFFSNGTRIKCNSFDLIELDLPINKIHTFKNEQSNNTKTSKGKKMGNR